MENTYTHDTRILAHRVLRQLTGKFVIVSEYGQQDKDLYKSKGYFALPIVNIRAEIQDKTFEEVYHSCLLLVKNGHATIQENKLDIFQSIVKVLHEGEVAYKSEFYLQLNKDDKNERKLKWPQKYWWVVMILSGIVCPIIVEVIQEVRKVNTIQSQPGIQVHDTFYMYDNHNLLDTLTRKDTNLLHIDKTK